MRYILIFFILILQSCTVTNFVTDTDDLYDNRDNRDSTRIRYMRNKINYYTPNYGWYGYGYAYGYHHEIYRSRPIIILPNETPNINYGKRPTRERQNQQTPSLNRRGRN
jgi:hypothetical protein